MNTAELTFYRDLLGDIKTRVRQAQSRAALSANAEMILMYWDVGRMIAVRQQQEGWGAGVIPRLAADLKNDLPEEKGFSERNIGYMIRFARDYGVPSILQQPVAKLAPLPASQSERDDSEAVTIMPQPVAQLLPPAVSPILQQAVAQIPWGICDAACRRLSKEPLSIAEIGLR
jgi:hypothetical protein